MTDLASDIRSLERNVPSAAASFAFTAEDFRLIAGLLRDSTGIELSEAKSSLVYARIAKRVRALGLVSFAAYREVIGRDPAECQTMIEALTTNTTSFFREPHHFEILEREVLPPLCAAARAGRPLRIWSSAASSGQEPYSIALTLMKVAPDAGRLDARILATDINSQMVASGETGTYGADEFETVGREPLSRYFTRTGTERGTTYTAGADLKALIRFRQLNLQADWPFRRLFDVIFCRNVMIYFSKETQTALWQRLAAQLAPGGYLFIGHSERVTGPCTRDLMPVGVTSYRKRTEA